MTETEREQERRKAKHRAYLKHQGRGGMVDAAAAVQYLRWLHDEHGLTYRTIEGDTGLTVRTLMRTYSGPPEIRARTRDLILNYQPESPGQWLPPHGTQRRGRALYAAGYTFTHVAAIVRIRECQYHYMITKAAERVTAEYAHRVTAAYDTLTATTPEAEGVNPGSALRARNIAAKRGYAPPGCWDTDTIDDPDAFPEWTGVCGTPRGRAVHRRAGIPICPACRTAAAAPVEQLPPFLAAELKLHAEARGLTPATLAARIGVHENTVSRWWNGWRAPGRTTRQELAHALGVAVADLEGPTP
ncbi:helix-turn-helix transcriptional regulator [Streptomyces sp. NPDC048211]|uniref:helix-turn-helix transcriptional regulator n=1 Tax=Streptomyces sp. NPDC048211 TaxID=3365516 RepID=UPI003722B53B